MPDVDYSDDLEYLTQDVTSRLVQKSRNGRFYCNAKERELQVFNHEMSISIKLRGDKPLNVVENFKYVDAWTQSIEKDIVGGKVLVWGAHHTLRNGRGPRLTKEFNKRRRQCIYSFL